jgi:hypothetical protein
MARVELQTGTLRVEQGKPLPEDLSERQPEIIEVDNIEAQSLKEYADRLAFNEEPVTIRIEPSAEENAPDFHPVWVNGVGAEVMFQGRWVSFGFLRVGEVITTKRKYVEVLLRSKRSFVRTTFDYTPDGDTRNFTPRTTSQLMAVSIVKDTNPRGAAWATELVRRYG